MIANDDLEGLVNEQALVVFNADDQEVALADLKLINLKAAQIAGMTNEVAERMAAYLERSVRGVLANIIQSGGGRGGEA